MVENTRILIVGAGNAGKYFLSEIKSNASLKKFEIIGFVDDDPKKLRTEFSGKKILGKISDIPQIALKYEIREIVICIPSAQGSLLRDIIALCSSINVNYKILPGIYDLMTGKASIEYIRNVELGDLFKRKPIIVDKIEIKNYITNKKIVVVGGSGSIKILVFSTI